MKLNVLQCALILVVGSSAMAGPPIWEMGYGRLVPPADPLDLSSLMGLEKEDDAHSEIDLSFSFPFEGVGYTKVWVGTNGCVQLGTLGFDGAIDYDLWESFEEFYNDGDEIGDPEPVLCPFNSDLDNTTDGSVWFNDFGDRVVFTWDEVGTNFEETHHLTFQVQLLADGTIIFGYDGVLDGEGESVAASSEGGSLDEGIVVGISDSEGTYPTPSIDFDLNGPAFSAGSTIFERWCYDAANSCGEDERNLGYTGRPNSMWDLDNQNVIFTPRAEGGFDVRSRGFAVPPARRRLVGRPSSGESARVVSIEEDFRSGTRGWIPGVSGGQRANRNIVPAAGPRRLPAWLDASGYGMMLRGQAGSDAISTLMKKRVGVRAGVAPNQMYVAEVSIAIRGEWPGAGVVVEAGVANEEQRVGLDRSDEALRIFAERAGSGGTIQHHRSLVATGDSPDLWLFVRLAPGAGEDPTVYVESISVRLTPVASGRGGRAARAMRGGVPPACDAARGER